MLSRASYREQLHVARVTLLLRSLNANWAARHMDRRLSLAWTFSRRDIRYRRDAWLLASRNMYRA